MTRFLLISILFLLTLTGLHASDYVWIEGEAMVSGTLHANHINVPKHKALSGGVSFGTNSLPERGRWHAIIPKAGEWHIYVRKFWKHGPFKWKINGGQEKELSAEGTMLLDSTGLDVRFQCINWVYLGKANFKKGKNILDINGTSKKAQAFVIDCFVITKEPFEPSGIKRPGEKLALSTPGNWAFEPDYDTFKKDVLGLRSLNEAIAGEKGYIRMTDTGNFVDGTGKPIRFWCTQGDLQTKPGVAQLRQHAKHIAKRGVNMYRHHGHLNPDPKENPMKTRESQIDAIQKMVAIMKKEGIYSTVSPFWATHSSGGSHWLPKFRGGKLTGLLFWNDDFKTIYKKWWRDLLERPNPYDDNKIPLGVDPALAIIQLQNEDSLLFWTFQNFKKDQPALYKDLENKFSSWLKRNAFPDTELIIDFWSATHRTTDQHRRSIQFLTECMYDFNQEMSTFIREDLKCKALINAGNWRTASTEKLLDHERWSYTANEVIGVNRYVSGNDVNDKTPHFSPTNTSGYQVNVGDTFQDVSCYMNPYKLATNAKQVKGHAYIISESTWVSPMSYQSEGPFLIASYSSLHGIDGYYWFNLGSIGYDTSMTKFQVANPAIMGGWPAAALMYRKGYIKQGEAVVHEERKLKGDMWDLRSTIIAEEAGFDANRDASVTPLSAIRSKVPTLSYLVGPVEVVYDGDPSQNRMIDFSKYIKKGVITSITGELTFDMQKNICLLNAPCAQGVSGFLQKAGLIKTDALEILSKNSYATVMAVSIDGVPLEKSKKVFLQITTLARPYKWKETVASIKGVPAKKIISMGSSPWNVRETNMTFTIKNKNLKNVQVLDENLYSKDTKIKASFINGKFSFIPPKNAIYMILEAKR